MPANDRTITVTAGDNPPVADNDSATVAEDAVATAIPVLVGDTDPDGDTLTILSASDPPHGTVVVAGNGLSLTYKPDANYQDGADSFTYVVTDGLANDTSNVSITVTAGNNPPVADNDSATVAEDAVATAIRVLVGDTDPDGDTLTILSASDPPHGTVVVASNGLSLTYKPNANYNGADKLTYVGPMTRGQFNTGHRIRHGHRRATIRQSRDNDSATVAEDAGMTVAVARGLLSDDTDPDGDTLTALVGDRPAAWHARASAGNGWPDLQAECQLQRRQQLRLSSSHDGNGHDTGNVYHSP